jgi:alanine dehydrogenase
MEIAGQGLVKAVRESRPIARGINTFKGMLTCRPVAESLGMVYTPLEDVLHGM